MRFFIWLVRALIFLLLLALALRNQQTVPLFGLVGEPIQAPMILMLAGATLLGALLGLGAWLPSWWASRRQWRKDQDRLESAKASVYTAGPSDRARVETSPLEHPPRDGL